MTTPYGTTTFRDGDTSGTNGFRRIDATDPEGGTERVEFHISNTAGQSATVDSGDVPTGFSSVNSYMDVKNSLYWDKQAMAEAPGNVSRAVVTHWLQRNEGVYDVHSRSRMIPHSIKRPLEGRIWFSYPDQSGAASAGTGTSPTVIGRVMTGGGSQLSQMTYNAQGMLTSRTDPAGRQTTYVYDTNGIDLLEVRQIRSGGYDVLVNASDFTTTHRPETITAASGQTTTVTYNGAGQLLTVTNPKEETTTYGYDTDGYLTSITGPATGATTTLTYDDYGRVRTVTASDNYAVTIDYDALNRVTRQTYPDDTYRGLHV